MPRIVTVPAPVTARPARSRLERPTKVRDGLALAVALAESTNVVAFVIEAIVAPLGMPEPTTNIPG